MILTPSKALAGYLGRAVAGKPLDDTVRKVLAMLDLTVDVCPTIPPRVSALGLAVAGELINGRRVILPSADARGSMCG